MLHSFRISNPVFILLTAALTLLPASAPSFADDDRYYDIQLLIFKYNRPENFASERWPQQWTRPDTENSIDLQNIAHQYRKDFHLPDSETAAFVDLHAKIKDSSRYQPLAQLSWRQRGLDKDHAMTIHIRAGRQYRPLSPLMPPAANAENGGIYFNIFEPVISEIGYVSDMRIRRYQEIENGADPGAPDSTLLHELEGTVKIVLSRFLHVYTDLLLLKPVKTIPETQGGNAAAVTALNNDFETDRSEADVYRLEWADDLSGDQKTLFGVNIKSHRRMRSGELHHIDHPLLGILVQAMPVTEADE